MRFFSRIVFICNCCFIISVILRFVELQQRAKNNYDGAIPFQPLESTLVILGYGAIYINVVFLLISIYRFLLKRNIPSPRWITIFNLCMFPLQLYYFIFSNF